MVKADHFAFGEALEKRVVKLFESLGFSVTRNPRGKGPDVVCSKKIASKKVKFIIQCKAHEPNKGIKTYPGLDKLVDEYAHKLKKAKATVALLVLSGYRAPEGFDAEKALKTDKVMIWTDKFIGYYESLHAKIGDYAIYQMLADLGIDLLFDKNKKIRALRFEQNNKVFFVFGIEPEWLLKAATVARRVDPELGPASYQRLLTKKRVVQEIPAYLNSEDWVLPNSIICATKKGQGIFYKNDKIILPSRVGSVWVMDGQHRLYSFANVKKKEVREKVLVVCTLFDSAILGKDAEAIQAQAFIDLNLHAKKVNPALLAELKNLLGVEDLPLRVVIRLRQLPLFKDKIKSYSDSQGSISLVTFATNNAIRELLRIDGPILNHRFSEEELKLDKDRVEELALKVIKNYFTLVSETFKKEWGSTDYSLTTDKGVRGLLKLLQKILEYTKNKYDSDEVKLVLKALKTGGVDLTRQNFLNQYAGEGGANQLARQWASIIVDNGIPNFDPTIEQSVIENYLTVKGEVDGAKNKINSWFQRLEGDVRGVLSFIDETTFDYLKKLSPKKVTSIRIMFGGVRSESKPAIEAALREMKAAGLKITLTRVQKKVYENGTFLQRGTYFHMRYLASDKYCIELESDLKDDGIANTENFKKLLAWNNPPQLEIFENHWKSAKSNVDYEYNWGQQKKK